MKINVVYINAAYFLWLALFPSFFAVFFSASSGTPGLLIAAIAIIPALLRYVKFTKIPISWTGVLIAMLVWILVVIPGVGGVSYSSKAYFSLFIAIFLLFFIFLAATWFEQCNSSRFYRLISMFWMAFFLIGWIGFFLKVKVFGYKTLAAAVFPFSEPSHFAIVAGPIYVISFFLAPKKFKLFIVLNIIFQAMLLKNLSLLLYTGIIGAIVFQVCVKNVLMPIIFTTVIAIGVIVAFTVNPAYVAYCTNRLTLSSKSTSLTVLAARQGIYAAKDSLVDTVGIGLGFQMLGTEKPNEITKIIASITHGIELSRPEGGFVAAKLIAELGVVGVALVILVFAQMVRSFFWLRQYWRNSLRRKFDWSGSQLKLVVAHSLIVAFFVEMFIRGIGYFSLGVILFVFSLLYIKRHSQHVDYDVT
ncbi:MAG: hypothetical protein A2103_04275 [Gammaproteobacteria bacterium GWF2_41_13]|nr:MAG: hypothetical protein A2103_04275 [Gammaproteobacteria bacterium GWF2_41_13]